MQLSKTWELLVMWRLLHSRPKQKKVLRGDILSNAAHHYVGVYRKEGLSVDAVRGWLSIQFLQYLDKDFFTPTLCRGGGRWFRPPGSRVFGDAA